jgi:predicted ester cyclase
MKKLFIILPLALILSFMVGCQDKEAMAELEEFKAQAEVEEKNKEIVKRVLEELNKGKAGNVEVYDELFAPDYKLHVPSMNPKPISLEEILEYLKLVFEAFPDSVWSIEDLIAAGDKVIFRLVYMGTHEEEFMGLPPTGNKVECGQIVITRIENGKIVEDRKEYDQLGFMHQLGMELKPKEGEK